MTRTELTFPGEPHVRVGDTPIHVGAVLLLQELHASGHDVTVAGTERVTVTPDDLDKAQQWNVEAFEADLWWLLTETGTAIH